MLLNGFVRSPVHAANLRYLRRVVTKHDVPVFFQKRDTLSFDTLAAIFRASPWMSRNGRG